jgi:hypothetical protein|tara:strand:+ start:547 stop:945 length:399 start_codon:yes stop_codon:yes gene_type:complete
VTSEHPDEGVNDIAADTETGSKGFQSCDFALAERSVGNRNVNRDTEKNESLLFVELGDVQVSVGDFFEQLFRLLVGDRPVSEEDEGFPSHGPFARLESFDSCYRFQDSRGCAHEPVAELLLAFCYQPTGVIL